jgi:hypothetical protein
MEQGASDYSSPARIVIVGVSESSGTKMNFAFEITNPSTAGLNKILIPITVYAKSYEPTSVKVMYGTHENTWHFRTAKSPITDPVSGSWTPFVTNKVQATSEWKINTKVSSALTAGDTYAFKLPYTMTDVTPAQSTYALA